MTTLLKDQVASKELEAIFSGRSAKSVASVAVREVRDLLMKSSLPFSVQHISFGIMRYLKSVLSEGGANSDELSGLIELLVTKFADSFRPQPKDALELVGFSIARNHYDSLGDCLRLLSASLRNQLGNPKNAFITICDEFLPLLKGLSEDALRINSVAVKSVVSIMFQAQANLSVLSAYLAGRSSKSSAVDSFVSRLFTRLEEFGPRVACLVLAEYVSRKRGDTDEDGNQVDYRSNEEFEFFDEILGKMSSLDNKVQLWRCMGELKMYRLRDDKGEAHRAALKAFLDACVSGKAKKRIKWKGLETVIFIDPVNFIDEVCLLVWKLLGVTRACPEADACMLALFRSFAVKGSLCDIVKKAVEASAGANIFTEISLSKILPLVVPETSPTDLLETCEYLIESVLTNTACIELLVPLVEFGFEKLPENLLSRASKMMLTNLQKLSDWLSLSLNGKKTEIAALMIVLVDGFRKVNIAWSLPIAHPGNEVVLNALSVIAKQDSAQRCSALLRMNFLTDSNMEIDDLLSGKDEIKNFATAHFLNASALSEQFSDRETRKVLKLRDAESDLIHSYPDCLLSSGLFANKRRRTIDESFEESSDLESLIRRTVEIIKKHARLVFSPTALRKSDFPADILALEMAWSNKADKATVEALLADVSSETQVYGLAVILEEARRNKTRLSDLTGGVALLEKISSFSSLAQIRVLLAAHSLDLDSRLTSELLVAASIEVLNADARDRPAIDSAYYALFNAISTGKDRRKIRLPWWTNKMAPLIIAVRGLIGSCISATKENDKVETAQYVVRIWKTIIDSLSSEKLHRISKSVAVMASEFIRLSGQISSADCCNVLDRGCCSLLGKLSQSEKEFLHAMLGKNDRETLRRINELLDKNFRFSGKV